jgi:hypothetical protein
MERPEQRAATIAMFILRLFFSACLALLALVAEFLFAGFFNWLGFAWPLRLLLDPGQNLYSYLVTHGFYGYSDQLLADMIFALKFDFVLNFLLFVWVLFSFPSSIERWIPTITHPKGVEANWRDWMADCDSWDDEALGIGKHKKGI